MPQVVEEILGVISTTTFTRPEKEHIPVFTMEEMQTSIDCFKRKKAGDKKGIRAEGLKERDDETKTKMKDISNEIKQENTVPDSWKKVMVKRSYFVSKEVTHHDWKRQNAHRPICTHVGVVRVVFVTLEVLSTPQSM